MADDDLEPRPVSGSRVTMTELMIPSYANFGGKVHGGILLGLMDQVAYAAASRHSGRYCVTVSVGGVAFRAPVEVGDLVSLHASVNHVGTTSLVVGIRVEAQNVRTSEVRHTNTSYFTMVAKGDDDRPTRVPPLLLETREDVGRFLEAMTRREVTARIEAELDDPSTALAVAGALARIGDQRCVLTDALRGELERG